MYRFPTDKLSLVTDKSAQRVVLVLCGSFNPPTSMHLNMFDIAASELRKVPNPIVGVPSP